MESSSIHWRKSSYSGNGGCVEVGTDGHTPGVHVRDTTARDRGMITVSTQTFAAFLAEVKDGHFDRLEDKVQTPARGVAGGDPRAGVRFPPPRVTSFRGGWAWG